jgi:formate-dependent phosphoribosylglycinamide formyltransferase (GAR transformylase)
MAARKLMLLGGISYLIPAIEVAHRHGCHVITADYLPDNIAHRYSDEYVNVSIINKEAVLHAAQERQIDGIMSFAVDPGVVSAAFVAEKMGLPFQCSYAAACILQDKALFRQFLAENGFNVPTAKGYSNQEEALTDTDLFHWPVIVKPVDSAGSKGVSRVDSPTQLPAAINQALAASPSKHFIIEDFLEKDGLSSGSESFFVDGKLLYNAFYDQFFDNEADNPYTPSGECWPSDKSQKHLEEVRSELQRLGDLLHFGTGLFNVEWRLCTNERVYLMEVSPRAGGNSLAELLGHAADIDLIDAEVCKAVGLPIGDIHEPHYRGFFSILVLHSERTGIFDQIWIDNDFERLHVIACNMRVQQGEEIHAFTGANASIGTLFLRFSSYDEMVYLMENHRHYVKIIMK